MEKGRFQLSAHRDIVFERVPNLNYSGDSLDFYDYRGQSNSLGYRGPNYTLVKPVGVKRIVVIGDSIAEGMRVANDDEIFARRLERELRTKGKSVEVLNFSVSGYNTQQEVATLREKALPYAPDLVILAYCMNDRDGIYPFILNPLIEQIGRQEGAINPLFQKTQRWLMWSSLYRFLIFNFSTDKAPAVEEMYREYLANAVSVEQAFAELAALSQQHEFGVFVLVFPFFDPDDPLFDNYAHIDEREKILKLATDLQFDALDLIPSLRECAKALEIPRALYADNLHPSALGHDCVARTISKHLEE